MLAELREHGFTLIEVIIAIAILLIGTLAAVPLFVFAREAAEINNRRMIAASLANAEMEYIRSLEFDQVGIEGGYPSGLLKASDIETIEGVTYKIERRVSWETEAADCSSDLEGNLYWDYKSVQVDVTVDAPRRPKAIVESLNTLIARPTFREPSPGSGIRICVTRGWKEYENKPVSGAKITITPVTGNATTEWTTSNSKGAGLFFFKLADNEDQRKYRITVEDTASMMVQPGLTPFELTVQKGKWASRRVYVEYPSYLTVTLKDILTGNTIKLPGSFVLQGQMEATRIEKDFFAVPVTEDVLGKIWPLDTYELYVQNVEGYHDTDWNYQNPLLPDGNLWDGTFPAPKSRLSLTIELVPIPIKPAEGETLDALDDMKWLDNELNLIEDFSSEARDKEGSLQSVRFAGDNPETVIRFTRGTTAFFAASAMYFEQELAIAKGNLVLNGQLFLFDYPVLFEEDKDEARALILRVPQEPGYGYSSGEIEGGESGVLYGEVHFVKGFFVEGDEKRLIGKGAYYFPNNIVLPDEAHRLIPWHKVKGSG